MTKLERTELNKKEDRQQFGCHQKKKKIGSFTLTVGSMTYPTTSCTFQAFMFFNNNPTDRILIYLQVMNMKHIYDQIKLVIDNIDLLGGLYTLRSIWNWLFHTDSRQHDLSYHWLHFLGGLYCFHNDPNRYDSYLLPGNEYETHL